MTSCISSDEHPYKKLHPLLKPILLSDLSLLDNGPKYVIFVNQYVNGMGFSLLWKAENGSDLSTESWIEEDGNICHKVKRVTDEGMQYICETTRDSEYIFASNTTVAADGSYVNEGTITNNDVVIHHFKTIYNINGEETTTVMP
jgi:hypothetical protein